ncbi:MAG TPA: 1-deoxy-D-xylulose-5-phosphate reductoisomerase [Gammaproteobacteria bacterium]|nr:1-deoxy-D-xylulose-5-phosphate reductoisomerase [Gammaproteobacteria bacterium]
MQQNITILGSTGSIGMNTLEVVKLHPERFKIFALTAHNNIERMVAQCLAFRPRYAVMLEAGVALQLEQRLREHHLETEVLSGGEALVTVASHSQVDTVMACIVGAAGLLPTLAAAKSGKRILLANKEALVMSGALLIEAVRAHNALLLPVDSEHNAIFQCLPADFKPGQSPSGIKRIILTASGGAFRNWDIERLALATPEQACTHPNWVMGAKITVDSATMMNKGLEVIEASYLFGVEIDRIEVVLHPQSVIHSMVEYLDRSVLAQLGMPDMRTPIAQTLSWPERINSGVESLDLIKVGRLDFEPVSLARYPCLGLAYAALKAGGTATAILNAANEIAVQAFLERKILFTDIPRLIDEVLNAVPFEAAHTLEQVLESDAKAREAAKRLISRSMFPSPTRGEGKKLRLLEKKLGLYEKNYCLSLG